MSVDPSHFGLTAFAFPVVAASEAGTGTGTGGGGPGADIRIEEALVEFLRRSPGVEDLVQGRVYPGQAPDDADLGWPRLVYRVLTGDGDEGLDGADGNPRAVFELECQGQGRGGHRLALDLADAIAAATGGDGNGPALESFGPGWFPPGAALQRWVQAVQAGEVRGGTVEQAAGGDPRPIHLALLQLTIFYV